MLTFMIDIERRIQVCGKSWELSKSLSLTTNRSAHMRKTFACSEWKHISSRGNGQNDYASSYTVSVSEQWGNYLHSIVEQLPHWHQFAQILAPRKAGFPNAHMYSTLIGTGTPMNRQFYLPMTIKNLIEERKHYLQNFLFSISVHDIFVLQIRESPRLQCCTNYWYSSSRPVAAHFQWVWQHLHNTAMLNVN